jgi:hypothetical protein
LLAASCEGQEITTIEGVSEQGALAAIQKAYGDWGGAQCGYCTPGFIMTVKSLLAENPDPSESDVRDALSSNLCRCTGYNQMYEAIRSAIAAESNGSVVSAWKRIFEPDSRSLLDIWVFEASPAAWQTLLDLLRKNYSLEYLEDSAPAVLPTFDAIWKQHRVPAPLLRIDLGGFTANTQFFSSDQIEINLMPEDVDSKARAESVFKLATAVARLLKKDVIFAPEHASASTAELKAMAFCAVDPAGRLSLGKASREIFR